MTPPSDRSEPWPRAIGCALTGQDTALATFGHRRSVRRDWEVGGTCIPPAHIAPDQASVEIYNGPLSEAGVLGFEDGCSLGPLRRPYPRPTLAEALWEAALAVDGHPLQV